MTLSSGFNTLLLTGLATYLSNAGIEMTYNTTGAYTALQTGIVLGNIPEEPNRIVTLTTYGISDDPGLSDSVVGIQIRCRSEGKDKRKTDDMDDAIFNLLHASTRNVLTTGVTIVQMLRESAGSLGQDAKGRWGSVSNYHATTWRPSTHRI